MRFAAWNGRSTGGEFSLLSIFRYCCSCGDGLLVEINKVGIHNE